MEAPEAQSGDMILKFFMTLKML